MTGRVYVANGIGNSVTVIDGASSTVVATVPVGNFPVDIAVNPASNRVYVTNASFDDQSLSVIDGVSNTILSTIPLAGTPAGLAVDATTGRIYVGISDLDRVDILDGANNTVVNSVAIGGDPRQPALNPNKHRLYVTRGDDRLVVVNTTVDAVARTIRVGSNPIGVAVNRSTKRIYVANNLGGSISVIDGLTNAGVATINEAWLHCCPASVAVNERTNKLYTSGSNGLIEVDGLTLQMTRSFQVADTFGFFWDRTSTSAIGRIYSSHLRVFSTICLSSWKTSFSINPSFEQSVGRRWPFPLGWRRGNLETLLDLRSLDAYDGQRSFRFTGAGGVTKALVQEISVSGAAGAVIHFEAFSKAAGASETGGAYTVVFRVYYDDGTQRTVHLPFTRGPTAGNAKRLGWSRPSPFHASPTESCTQTRPGKPGSTPCTCRWKVRRHRFAQTTRAAPRESRVTLAEPDKALRRRNMGERRSSPRGSHPDPLKWQGTPPDWKV